MKTEKMLIDIDSFLRSKFILVISLMIAFIPIDMLLGLYYEAILLIPCIIGQSLIVFIKMKNIKLKQHLMHLWLIFVIFGFIFFQGGIGSPITLFVLTPIISAFLTFGLHKGKYYTFISSFLFLLATTQQIFEIMPFEDSYVSYLHKSMFETLRVDSC